MVGVQWNWAWLGFSVQIGLWSVPRVFIVGLDADAASTEESLHVTNHECS